MPDNHKVLLSENVAMFKEKEDCVSTQDERIDAQYLEVLLKLTIHFDLVDVVFVLPS